MAVSVRVLVNQASIVLHFEKQYYRIQQDGVKPPMSGNKGSFSHLEEMGEGRDGGLSGM